MLFAVQAPGRRQSCHGDVAFQSKVKNVLRRDVCDIAVSFTSVNGINLQGMVSQPCAWPSTHAETKPGRSPVAVCPSEGEKSNLLVPTPGRGAGKGMRKGLDSTLLPLRDCRHCSF